MKAKTWYGALAVINMGMAVISQPQSGPDDGIYMIAAGIFLILRKMEIQAEKTGG